MVESTDEFWWLSQISKKDVATATPRVMLLVVVLLTLSTNVIMFGTDVVALIALFTA